MEIAKGKVEAISFKDPKDGKYGRWAGFGLKIAGTWYNGIANEVNGSFNVLDKDKNVIKEGDEVEFVYEMKNNYPNINQKNFTKLGVEVAKPSIENVPKPEVKDIPAHIEVKTSPGDRVMSMRLECLKLAVQTRELADVPADKVSSTSMVQIAEKYMNYVVNGI